MEKKAKYSLCGAEMSGKYSRNGNTAPHFLPLFFFFFRYLALSICDTPWVMFNTVHSCMYVCNTCSVEVKFNWIHFGYITEHEGRAKNLNDVMINNAELKSKSVD